MTVHVFPTYVYCDQRQYMQRYLRKLSDKKIQSFTTRLIQLNTYLPYFLPNRPGQLVLSFPGDDIKETLYHTMSNTLKKKVVEQGNNYLDGPTHSMAEFFETRIENLEKLIPPSVPSRNNKKSKKGSKKRKAVTCNDFEDKDSDQEHSVVLSEPRHVRIYPDSMHYAQGTGQASKIKKDKASNLTKRKVSPNMR